LIKKSKVYDETLWLTYFRKTNISKHRSTPSIISGRCKRSSSSSYWIKQELLDLNQEQVIILLVYPGRLWMGEAVKVPNFSHTPTINP
jgi:hypothetical protein